MFDPFGRSIDYLRVSVTDRCDFRCVYCMSEQMSFLPKSDILSLEELERLIGAFIRKGTRKIRLTGGEPLVRRDIMRLIRRLGAGLEDGTLDELTLTTNGSQLTRFATQLADAGIRRINVSLDTLDADRFAQLTRWGRLDRVLDGIAAAKSAGLAIKINTVALADTDDAEYDRLITWCGEQGFDFTLIEVMPMGDIGEGIRLDQHMPLDRVEERLNRRWTLRPIAHRTGGPARYVRVAETGGRLGFITPLSHNFCESCNRVRITCTGRLYMCLGQEDSADLRTPMRASEGDGLLELAIDEAIGRKPRGHDFVINRDRNGPAVPRHMSVTGG